MGCSSSTPVQIPLPKIVHVQFKTINEYIDQIPLFIIQKIKQKFDYYCNHKFELEESQFDIMYSGATKNQVFAKKNSSAEILRRLYEFYTDIRLSKLNFKKFITKYAILSKCSQKIFSEILYFLYTPSPISKSKNQQTPMIMKKQNYDTFVTEQRNSFSFQPTKASDSEISQQQFYQYLKESGFLWEECRRKFLLIDKDDIPFQAITRALIDMDVSDFVVGEEYYILSSSWFERWSYYYQGAGTDHSDDNYKSTKLVKQRSSLASGKKRKSINRSKNDLSLIDNTWMIQRPTMITYEDIEGEFKGEFKQNIKANQEIRIVSKQLWEMFKKTMPAEREYKRVAISANTVDLYPKTIYFFRTDRDGKIVDSSFRTVQMSLKKPIRDVSLYALESNGSKEIGMTATKESTKSEQKKYYFIKNFGDNLWSEQKQQTALGRCSIYPRFLVVQTPNKPQFIQTYFRNKKSLKNISYGDRVYTYFSFTKKVIPAYIVRLPSQKKALLHYEGYNFRYESQVAMEELAVEEEDALAESTKKESTRKGIQDGFSFKGMQNVGNTCFINSVIQCLIASPILEEYFCKKKFKEEKQPLLYQLCELASSLLTNKKISPVKLKKTIDMQLINFSGNDQHDAQQFLLELLNKLNQQIKKVQKQQETVFEYLFQGKVQSTLQCYKCQNVSKKEEDLTVVSLPIPEPEYNSYTVYVFPIYEQKIRKIVLRLHRTCKVNDYLVGFEERLGRYAKDFIFTEIYSRNLKIRHDLLEKEGKDILLVNAITPSAEIQCFQRFQTGEFMRILEQNKQDFKKGSSLYFDYLDSDTDKWLYGRYLEGKAKIEIMNQDNSFSVIKNKNVGEASIRPLGEKTRELIYKKMITRKYNEILQKMEHFGFYGVQYMAVFPKQVTFAQLEKLIDLILSNFLKTSLSASRRKPYFLKICQMNKQKCLYCNRIEQRIPAKEDPKPCCRLTEEQLGTPIMWVAREKEFTIFVDWIKLDEINEEFGNIEMDSLSANAEKIKGNDKIEVEDCLRLYQQPQNVEMECQKCKCKNHRKTETMKYVPNILILHMKEFRVTHDLTLVKMDVNLKWIEFLDITKYSVGQKGTVYELYAYVRHHGTSQSGHYTCAIKRKHPFENKKVWVNFDDDATSILDNEQKNIDSAYLLFFKRVDMPNSGYVHFADF